jgi:hypothetical protein
MRRPRRLLPPSLGKADSAHRALRRHRWAGPHAGSCRLHRSLESRIARAWRRACRPMPMASLMRARNLGLVAALPCLDADLPNPDLSKTLRRAQIGCLNPTCRSGAPTWNG